MNRQLLTLSNIILTTDVSGKHHKFIEGVQNAILRYGLIRISFSQASNFLLQFHEYLLPITKQRVTPIEIIIIYIFLI